MLDKLNSRGPIDLPTDGWKTSKPFFVIIAGLAVLFLILPLLGALAFGAMKNPGSVGLGIVSLFLGLLFSMFAYRTYRRAS